MDERHEPTQDQPEPTQDQPEPTPAEQDAPLERRAEEDAQRYPAHDDPERVIDPSELEGG